jgi:hypothetical protein
MKKKGTFTRLLINLLHKNDVGSFHSFYKHPEEERERGKSKLANEVRWNEAAGSSVFRQFSRDFTKKTLS